MKIKDIEKTDLMLYVSLIAFVLYLILPSFWKFLTLILTTLTFGYVFSKKGVNFYIVFGLLVLFLILPTSLITLDSSQSYKIVRVINDIDNIMNIITTIIFLIPIGLIILGIYAILFTNVNEGVKAFTIALVVAIVLMIFTIVFDAIGLHFAGMEIMKGIIDFIWGVVKTFYDVIRNIASLVGINMAPIEDPSIYLNRLDSSYTPTDNLFVDLNSITFKDGNNFSFIFTSIYPLILSGIMFFMALAYKWNKKKPYEFKEEGIQFSRPDNRQFQFLVFELFMLVIVFIYYLSFSEEAFLNYRNVLFISIYTIITLFCSIMLFFGIGITSKIDLEKTFEGIIFGVFLLYISNNMFNMSRTLDVVSNEYSTQAIDFNSIIVQFLFVAPTESLIFHIFIPSLTLYFIVRNESIDYIVNEIEKTESEINTYSSMLSLPSLKKKVKDYMSVQKQIEKRRKKLNKLKSKKRLGIKDINDKISDENFIYFIIVVIISNIVFSSIHFFKSQLNFFVFWSSGLGFIYLSAGVILSLIAYRFGWVSCVISHALYNTLILILTFIV